MLNFGQKAVALRMPSTNAGGPPGTTSPLTRLEHRPLYMEMPEAKQNRLQEVRHALLTLHKALVESERITYESTVGAIRSPNHFLRLLTQDPWFAWLQPLSQLIVSMDEALDAKEPLAATAVDALLKQTRLMLVPAENSEGFARHYFDALQRDPDVVLAHGELMKVLGRRKT